MFDVVDVLPLAERVAVLAPARTRPLADVHQEPVYVDNAILRGQGELQYTVYRLYRYRIRREIG